MESAKVENAKTEWAKYHKHTHIHLDSEYKLRYHTHDHNHNAAKPTNLHHSDKFIHEHSHIAKDPNQLPSEAEWNDSYEDEIDEMNKKKGEGIVSPKDPDDDWNLGKEVHEHTHTHKDPLAKSPTTHSHPHYHFLESAYTEDKHSDAAHYHDHREGAKGGKYAGKLIGASAVTPKAPKAVLPPCHTGNVPVFKKDNIQIIAGGKSRGVNFLDPNVNIILDLADVAKSDLRRFPTDWKIAKYNQRRVDFYIRDFSTPDLPKDFWYILWEDLKAEAAKMEATEESPLGVLVVCAGGHGRTGTVLSALAYASGMYTEDPIKKIRDIYCSNAVESTSQVKYLEDIFDFVTIEKAAEGGGIWEPDDDLGTYVKPKEKVGNKQESPFLIPSEATKAGGTTKGKDSDKGEDSNKGGDSVLNGDVEEDGVLVMEYDEMDGLITELPDGDEEKMRQVYEIITGAGFDMMGLYEQRQFRSLYYDDLLDFVLNPITE